MWLLKVTSRSLVLIHGLAAAGLLLSALQVPTLGSWIAALVASSLVPVHVVFWRRLLARVAFRQLVDETEVLRAAQVVADRRLGLHEER